MGAAVDSSETFSGFEESMTKRPIYTDQHHSELAFHRFSLLREKKILTDAVILSNDDKRFNVHSAIMAGTSDYYFNNLLNANDHNTPLNGIDAENDACKLDIDSAALEMIITFCYSGAIELTVDNVEIVLAGAKELQIESLIFVCSEMLEEMLDMSNCIRLLEIADKNHLEPLRTLSLEVVSDEMPQLNKLPEFYHMNGSQMLWLIELLSNDQSGCFGTLLSSIYVAESSFSALRPAFNDDMRSAFRAAFIAGFFEGEKYRSSQTDLSVLDDAQRQSDIDAGRSESVPSSSSSSPSSLSECEMAKEPTSEHEMEEQSPSTPVHILGLLKGNIIQFNTLRQIGNKYEWERLSTRVELTQAIVSNRDAFMVPVNNEIVIFFMQNGSISQAQRLAIETTTMENIALPNDIDRAELALFCPLNDTIYCFARNEQQFFHSFDLRSNVWRTGQIGDMRNAKCIVGVKDELYFIGCGFDRKMVRSYHVGRNEWTERGSLRQEEKETCFKAIALDETIYVVMSCYDSTQICRTSFIVQQYDSTTNDWIIIKRIYDPRLVEYFNLEVAENYLYLFSRDGEMHIYNKEQNEWCKGPSIDDDAFDVTMCMVAVKSDECW